MKDAICPTCGKPKKLIGPRCECGEPDGPENDQRANWPVATGLAGKELFELVQGDQGHGFISDAIECEDDKTAVRMAEISLFYTNQTQRKLRKFLRRWKTLRETGPNTQVQGRPAS